MSFLIALVLMLSVCPPELESIDVSMPDGALLVTNKSGDYNTGWRATLTMTDTVGVRVRTTGPHTLRRYEVRNEGKPVEMFIPDSPASGPYELTVLWRKDWPPDKTCEQTFFGQNRGSYMPALVRGAK